MCRSGCSGCRTGRASTTFSRSPPSASVTRPPPRPTSPGTASLRSPPTRRRVAAAITSIAAAPSQLLVQSRDKLSYDVGCRLDSTDVADAGSGVQGHRGDLALDVPTRGGDLEPLDLRAIAAVHHVADHLTVEALRGLDRGPKHAVRRIGPTAGEGGRQHGVVARLRIDKGLLVRRVAARLRRCDE